MTRLLQLVAKAAAAVRLARLTRKALREKARFEAWAARDRVQKITIPR